MTENLTNEDIIYDNSSLLKKFVNLCNITRKYTFEEIENILKQLAINFNKIQKFIDKLEATTAGEVELPLSQVQVFDELMKKYNNDEILFNYLHKNLIVSIASNYDYFIFKFLSNIIFDKKNFGIIGKEIPAMKVWQYQTKEELLKDCVDDAISDLMRKSHKEQIEWIEKKFNIEIINSFSEWKTVFLFFEIRNIIVHNDGVVNNVFIQTLKQNGIAVEKFELGSIAYLDNEFILKAVRAIIDFSVYLYSLLMQKLYKNIEDIDCSINDIIYEQLCDENYIQVISLVENILKSNQKHNNEFVFIFTINKCIALKKKHNEGYVKILENLDWSNCDSRYRIAKEVLLENNEAASKIMESLDKNEMINYYLEWPLFKDFIKTKEFKSKFKEIYGIEFEDKLAKISEEKALFLADKKILESNCEDALNEVAVASNVDEEIAG